MNTYHKTEKTILWIGLAYFQPITQTSQDLTSPNYIAFAREDTACLKLQSMGLIPVAGKATRDCHCDT